MVVIKEHIKQFLATRIGMNPIKIAEAKWEDLIEERMKVNDIHSLLDYTNLLMESHKEQTVFIDRLIVGETWFFRDGSSYLLTKQYCQQLLNFERNNRSQVRVLSIPCSSGEEPLSIAFSLLEANIHPSQFLIEGIDISSELIEKAKNGHYAKSSFRESNSPLIQRRYFRQGEGSSWTLLPKYRHLVRYRKSNILYPDFIIAKEMYDIIYCKNLLIYLTEEARRKVLTTVEALLMKGGLLFVGSAEASFFEEKHFKKLDIPQTFGFIKQEKKSWFLKDTTILTG